MADEICRALMAVTQREPFESVHTSRMAECVRALINPELEARMDLAQRIVGLVRSMRAKTSLKVRQPLARIAIPASAESRRLIEQMTDVILEEVNVKTIEFIDESSPVVRKTATANFKLIGPKFGKSVNAVAKRIKEMTTAEILDLDRSGSVSLEVNGAPVRIVREDATISAQSIEGWLVDSDAGLTVALDTNLTPELIEEGLAREFVNRIQNMRKDAGLQVTDRIRVNYAAPERISAAIANMSDYIQSEVLAISVEGATNGPGDHFASWEIDGDRCEIVISRV
jgi:isoleucyl-tRNA synthetase